MAIGSIQSQCVTLASSNSSICSIRVIGNRAGSIRMIGYRVGSVRVIGYRARSIGNWGIAPCWYTIWCVGIGCPRCNYGLNRSGVCNRRGCVSYWGGICRCGVSDW